MPGAEWFPGARLNYAEHLVGTEEDRDRVAVVARSQTRPPLELTFGELREQAGRVRAGLQRLGVGPGDRVVAYMPNIPETLAAFIATASLGAIWATCAPEFGARSVVGRFGQIEPRVLLTVGGYGYRDRYVDRRAEVEAIRGRLPTLEHVVAVPYGEAEVPDAIGWDELTAESAPLEFDPVAFDHPLYVLFSSGTTGLPKAIVHGHGGQLIEHHKNQGLGWDLKPGGRLLWFSTTAWMMWNALVSALLLRSSIVMLDGDPAWPDLLEQWRLAERAAADRDGRQPGLPDGLPQGGPRRSGRECDLCEHPHAVHGRLAAAGRGLPVRLRAARPGRAAEQRLGRDRRLHRARLGRLRAAGVRGRDHRAVPGRRRARVRRRGQRGAGRRARRAGDHPADALDAGRRSGTTPTASATAVLVLRPLPGRVAPGRLDQVHRARAAASSPAAPTPP